MRGGIELDREPQLIWSPQHVHPLHFEDLEPHRFEDLVRQLIYDFRNWSSIEAIGRSGSDEGVDIRAAEKTLPTETRADEDDGTEFDEMQALPEHIWIIQCKRERSIGPTEVTRIAANYFSSIDEAPYGYMLIASCNFSKKARDAFRAAATSFGIQEYFLWGKAEIEDQLFLPKNDHLLFAYFGISLQVRRRSIKTELRSKLALKRKLVKELGDVRQALNKMVLIRDPRETTYPHIDEKIGSQAELKWRYWQAYGFQPLDHIAFVTKSCFAYADWNKQRWDAILEMDDAWPYHPSLADIPQELENRSEDRSRFWRFWNQMIPKENQAWYKEIQIIPFDRILAIDEIGDAYHEPPHLLVEYREGRPFEDRVIK